MSPAFCASALMLSSRVALRLSKSIQCTRAGPIPLCGTSFLGSLQYRSCKLAYSNSTYSALCSSMQATLSTTTPSDNIDFLRARFTQISNFGPSDLRVHERLIRNQFPYKLDNFQLEALSALSKGENVVLSAPTGAGKTVVGEMAVYMALCRNLRVFYTTPLKALSNQKFYDFKKQFGAHRVGLLTGDVTVNRDADVVVMTTEIYRNMLYADQSENIDAMAVTDNLFAVVFDEFHYLNDRDRGTVWEESVINSPEHVLLVALSATMSNTPDVRDWFRSVQGPTRLIESGERPVPLNFAYCDERGVTPLFADAMKPSQDGRQRTRGFVKRKTRGTNSSRELGKKMHPKLLRQLKEAKDEAETGRRQKRRAGSSGLLRRDEAVDRMKGKFRDISHRAKRRTSGRDSGIPSYPFVVRSLRRKDMLPCIVFIFSRAGCDRAAISTAHERDPLLSEVESKRIRQRLDLFVVNHPGMVQLDRLNLAMKGIASHHAGLLPLWKLCVEELFQDGLIKVVFATETLAAGINMPARTTVISALMKRVGEEGIVPLTTSAVLQMAGRAGRRGKDVVGHSMILRSRSSGALEAFKVLTADVDALESKFTPNYGMVLNLLSVRSLSDAKKLVDRSFGNFLRQKHLKEQADNTDEKRQSEDEAETILREKVALEAILEESRSLLKSVRGDDLRSYVKALERVKAEKRALAYLVQQSSDMDAELIEDSLTFAPPGTRLLLKMKKKTTLGAAERSKKRPDFFSAISAAGEGDLGERLRTFYLDVMDPVLEEIDADGTVEDQCSVIEAALLDMHSDSAGVLPTFAAVDALGTLQLFNHKAVARMFYDVEVLDVESCVENWSDLRLPPLSEWESVCKEQFSAPLPEELSGVVDLVKSWQSERAHEKIAEDMKAFEAEAQHPEVYAQEQRVQHSKNLVRSHVLHKNESIATILAAKRAIPKIEATLNGTMDPLRNKRRKGKASQRYTSLSTSDVAVGQDFSMGKMMDQNGSWDDFMSIASVLQYYGFLDEEHNVTSLGGIGAKVRSSNELWTSLVLLQPSLENISPVHLAAVLGSTQMEGARNDVYVEKDVSSETKEQVAALDGSRVRLAAVQAEFGVFKSVCLDAELMGLVEMWASGVSWIELLRGTSLQEGDACRILRQVLDVLRQVPYLPVVSEGLKRNSKRAVALLDRFPVTDDQTYVVRESERLD